MTEIIPDQGLLNELIDQAHNPPGQDPVLGAFYAATIRAIDTQKPFGKLVTGVKTNRPDITDKHFVNLLFRTFQFQRFQTGNLNYRIMDDIEWWSLELDRIANTPEEELIFKDTLRQKTTTTTIYQRYAGPHAVLAYLLNGNSVTITDLGCGGNYGLRGMELREPFKPVTDQTPGRDVTKFLAQPINLLSGLAVDKEDPDDEEVRRWRLACNFYPKELDGIKTLQDFEQRIRGSRRIKFMQGDLLRMDFNPKHQSSAIILSTMLYQLQRQDQVRLLGKVRDWLEKDGILIVQDFAEKDSNNPTHLDFSESWFGRGFSYRTFIASEKTGWIFQEALQWDNGRCTSVRAGQDFEYVFSQSPQEVNSFSATLAHSTS